MNVLRNALIRAVESGEITITEIARQVGCPRLQVYRYLRGEQVPSYDRAESLAKVIGKKIVVQNL